MPTDFKPEELTKTTEQHGKDISDLDIRLKAMEVKLEPAQIAITLETASADSKKLTKLFSKLFCEMLTDDKDVKAAIEGKMNETDRHFVYGNLKRWGKVIGAIVIFIFGAVAKELIEWLGGLLPPATG